MNTSPKLVKRLSKHVCSGDHVHDVCQGSDTIKTGFYNEILAENIVKGLVVDKCKPPNFPIRAVAAARVPARIENISITPCGLDVDLPPFDACSGERGLNSRRPSGGTAVGHSCLYKYM